MAVSRRLRFEVLRRDGHTCRYCGAQAPDVKLTVDHVTPTALGGKDEPGNLVTACAGCNGGKSSIAPDSPLVADVAADALRWAQARATALESWREQRAALSADLDVFSSAWDVWGIGEDDERRNVPRDSDWTLSVEQWLDQGFSVDDLVALIPKAMRGPKRRSDTGIAWSDRWRYYCGVIWRTLDEIQEDTASTLGTGASPPGSPSDAYDRGYNDGFDDGRAHERSSRPPDDSERRMCIECDEQLEHGFTGMCLNCWTQPEVD